MINFPSSIDALTNPASTDPVSNPSHATQHANANDAIEALEAKVGANSSAVTTSHDYKLSGVTGSDKAASLAGTEALTGETINGLTPTALATGFTLAGGTTSKTLTVPLDATVSGTNTGDQTLSDATISTTDITTNDVSTSKHGFAPKAPNDSTKFLRGDGTWAVPASGSSSTVVYAIVNSQVNVSSIGSTYTDAAGNTYGETGSQTRLTMPALPTLRVVVLRISWHVNAGTGTRELYNVTDGSSLSTGTTTSTTEVVAAALPSAAASNAGDSITIRLKNSGAGNTVTIDDGGMMEGDYDFNLTSTGHKAVQTSTGEVWTAGYPSSYSIGLLRALSTATATFQFGTKSNVISISNPNYTNVGATFGTTEANTVITRTPTVKLYSQGGSGAYGVLDMNVSALSANGYGAVVSLQLSADNI